MKYHHTKCKGDIGVLKAKCDLFNKSVNLRVNTPNNSQKKGLHLASDYREVP
jgi:hypothetical protein